MKSVLISIRPEWCKKILTGEKTVEVRKTRPRLKTPFKVYIYCTLAASKEFKLDDRNWDVSARNHGGWPDKRGRVIAEFACDEIRRVHIPQPAYQDKLDKRFIDESCLSYNSLHNYCPEGDAYFWHISDLKVYDEPKELETLTVLRETKFGYEPDEMQRAPQSWRYVEEL